MLELEESVYDETILRHAKAPRGRGLGPDLDQHGEARSTLCGDRVRVAIRVESGAIADVAFDSEACAVCVAAASMMVGVVRGASPSAAAALHEALRESLHGGVWTATSGELPSLRGLTRHPSRRACALLPWLALDRAIGLVEPGKPHRSEAPSDRVPSDRVPHDPIEAAYAWTCAHRSVAVATLVSIDGRGPCPVGSRLVLDDTGMFVGSVSGGCVESAVLIEAAEVLRFGQPRLLRYALCGEKPTHVGMPCGAAIEVFVQRVDSAEPFARMLDARRGRARGSLSTDLATGELVFSDAPSVGPTIALSQATRRFVEPLLAQPRILAVGATDIARSLAELASTVGFRVTIVEPRSELAHAAQRAGLDVVGEFPGDVLPSLLDETCALVTLGHDSKLDDPALAAGLRSPAFYIGALGSRATQAARRARLAERGFSADEIARIHGPAGLAIDATGPGEIALSILAQIVKTRRAKSRPRVGAVLLAAGASRRMGDTNKLLVEIGGKPVVRHVAEALTGAQLAGPIVVVVSLGSQLLAALAGLDVEIAVNEHADSGMGSSLACGVRAIASRADGVLVALGDMPRITSSQVSCIAAALDSGADASIIAPVVRGRRGHPVLFPRRFFDDLAALAGDAGARTLLERNAGAITNVEIDDDAIVDDVDDPISLARVAERMT